MSDDKLLCVLNNNNLILNLLQDELEENELLFSYLMPKKRKSIDSLFLNRESEGYFNILINRFLFENDIKFREFFRINREQFNFLLSLIEVENTKLPSMRVKHPISAAEKLAITIRYVQTVRKLSKQLQI